jgi:hypothetical protein
MTRNKWDKWDWGLVGVVVGVGLPLLCWGLNIELRSRQIDTLIASQNKFEELFRPLLIEWKAEQLLKQWREQHPVVSRTADTSPAGSLFGDLNPSPPPRLGAPATKDIEVAENRPDFNKQAKEWAGVILSR